MITTQVSIDRVDAASIVDTSTKSILINKMTKAVYGQGNTLVDVTDIVRNIAPPTFTVSNGLFSDPCPGKMKLLIITLNDGELLCSYPEGSIINSTTYELVQSNILKAFYGFHHNVIDVTTIVQQQNKPFIVSNDLFTDPCPGNVKALSVLTTYGQSIYPENTLVIMNSNVCTHYYM
jgi:hypothetical protein